MASKARARRSTAGRPGVRAYDMADVAWQDAGKAGIRQKIVHADQARGRYLGLIGFEPLSQTGLHQHLGTAISYFLQGSLTDYQGSAVAGQAGINLKGATHDAITYDGCLIAARLEA
ncbi:MAG: cupin domain-containing protein, partial [Candidatus Eiseniibacteriota bacterium]